MKAYFLNVAIGLDLFASAILGGQPGETISGRAGRAYQQNKLWGRLAAPVIDWLLRNPNHCVDAIQSDIRRATVVIQTKDG